MLILVVEDEALLAMTLEYVLVEAGHQVLGPAATASAALALAERSHPDLAFVDIMLRDGSRGTALAHELQTRWNTPVVFASASGSAAQANRDVAIGYLAKPYSPEDAVATVEVARCILEGGTPPPPAVPRGLEVFSTGAA